MTVNLFCITNDFAVCVADRRFTSEIGDIVSDRAKKILLIQCQDARVIAAFNGYAGKSTNDSPIDWILRAKGLGAMNFSDLVNRIKLILENNLKKTPRNLARLSLTLCGFQYRQPVLVHISNYESLEPNKVLKDAQEVMTTEWFSKDFLSVVTGSYNALDEASLKRKFETYYKHGTTPEAVRRTMLKAARDVSFLGGRAGNVGANCHSVILDVSAGYTCNLHAVGGTSVKEFPDTIGVSSTFSNIVVDTNPSKDGPAWGHPEKRNYAKLKDQSCRRCGNPVPSGQKQCGVCDATFIEQK